MVLGQGVVGLLLTSVLARFPLASLCAVDALEARHHCALRLGAHEAFDPRSDDSVARLKRRLAANNGGGEGADLIFEVSGAPEALNLAIDCSGFASRIVIGSWYGTKSAAIALGGAAHRNRLKLITSQVSTLAPELSGRWDKARRFATAWAMLRALDPAQLITARHGLGDAAALYHRLHTAPESAIQAVFTYPNN